MWKILLCQWLHQDAERSGKRAAEDIGEQLVSDHGALAHWHTEPASGPAEAERQGLTRLAHHIETEGSRSLVDIRVPVVGHEAHLEALQGQRGKP